MNQLIGDTNFLMKIVHYESIAQVLGEFQEIFVIMSVSFPIL